jgi:cytochrome c peroxidase
VAARVELGRRLFYDADLSANGTMACATCHEQRHAFADGNATHPGVTDEPGLRNVPGLANVGRFARLTMADPAMTTLERQVETPLFGTHPVEMGMKGRAGEFARRLGGQACYKAMFARAFPAQQGRIDTGTVALALAAFERSITATRAPVDQAPAPCREGGQGPVRAPLRGLPRRAGLHRLCLSSHRPDARSGRTRADGRHRTRGRPGRPAHPSLRNVALTGPWWHDGSAPSLASAIARHHLGLAPGATAPLIAYLDAMTDPTLMTRADLAMPATACGQPL